MRILFFLNNVSKSRHFDGVIGTLAERGHTVILAAARQRNRPLALPKGLTAVNRRLIAQGSAGRIEVTACPVRRVDAWRELAPVLRSARDYLRFRDARYAHADKLERRSASAAPAGWPAFVQNHEWIGRHWRSISRALAVAERVIPSDPLFEFFIRYEAPDVVLVTPLVDYGSYQTDCVKAAHRVGVPVAFLPFSWDNLTNRGLVRVAPDRVLVWNEIQKREAVDLHGVREDGVIVTGAARFDDFIAMSHSTSREEFCLQNGLDVAFPFLLYVCSSEFVAPREVEFVKDWIHSLRGAPHASVRSCGVLVRPHPAHAKQWRHVTLAEFPNTTLWVEKQTMNADQGLYDSLHHAAAVVGLNTSAMIEAGLLAKPVHTIMTGAFAGGQEQTLHFEYLRAQNGGLLHEARSFDEHLQQLDESLRGNQAAARERTLRFVTRFVRPRGLDAAVTPIMVEEIERTARIVKRPGRTAPWHYPLRWALRTALAAGRSARAGARQTRVHRQRT
jgi:hypothetical protein